jgi:hypothetical protein
LCNSTGSFPRRWRGCLEEESLAWLPPLHVAALDDSFQGFWQESFVFRGHSAKSVCSSWLMIGRYGLCWLFALLSFLSSHFGLVRSARVADDLE